MKTYLKLYKILAPGEQRLAIKLLLLMIVGMVLETLGISMVIPAMAALAEPETVRKFLFTYGNGYVGILSDREVIYYGMGVLVGTYCFKTLFLTYLSWFQTHFVFNAQASLSQRMFKGYISLPYSFHLQHNSSVLIRNTLSEVQQFMVIVLASTQFLSELLVVIGVTALLFFVEPVGALVVMLSLGGAGFGLYRISRKHMLRWGKARQFHEGQRLKHLQQGFGGIKDAKLLGREKYFTDTYAQDNFETARVVRLQYFFQSLPRLILEFLVIIGLVVLILLLVFQGRPMDSIVPTLALFAATAFRLMPSANRMLSSLNSIRYGHAVIETLNKELLKFKEIPTRKPSKELSFSNTLSLEAVTYCYEGAGRVALRNVSIKLKRGDTIGFIGESGAGKSTLIDLMLGLITPTDGFVKIDGENIHKNLRSWQNQIGYVPQAIYLTDDTLRKNIAFGVPEEEISNEQVLKALNAAHLSEFVTNLPEGIETLVGEAGARLSGGQRQRIGIARALYHNPSILVLDEATSALDNESEKEVMAAVSLLKKEKTILIIAHRLSTVNNCDFLYRLEGGEVVDKGKPKDLVGAL